MIDHVDIRVSDREASERFYDTVFAAIGKERPLRRRVRRVGRVRAWSPTDGPVDAEPAHRLLRADAPSSSTPSTRAGVEAGYRDDGAPGPRPQYGDDYYGGFLRDPDGNSVEAVYDAASDRETGAIDHLWLRTRRPRRRPGASTRRSAVAASSSASTTPDHVQFVTGGGVVLVRHRRAADRARPHRVRARDRTSRSTPSTQAAIEAGYTDNGAPGERAVYHPGYYGAFVLDPDGHNVEAVNHNR